MNLNNLVTIIMTTMRADDFTNASVWSLRKFYPKVKIIFADGDRGPWLTPNCMPYQIIRLPKGSAEDLRNAAATLVETPYTLFMDNDCKVLGKGAIELLLEPFFDHSDCAQSGAYGVKVADWKKRHAWVGTIFTDYLQVDAMPCYFSLHSTHAFRKVGGFPKRWFYDSIPKRYFYQKDQTLPGYSGDFTITTLYKELGLRAYTPKQRVPVLHWGQATLWWNKPRPVEDWWYKNCKHRRIDPLNDCVKTDGCIKPLL